jgi:hypothetical protein
MSIGNLDSMYERDEALEMRINAFVSLQDCHPLYLWISSFRLLLDSLDMWVVRW